MITYNFKTIEDFVSYMDNRAKDMRRKAEPLHPRTHARQRLESGAAEIESLAAIVRSSNLEVPGGLIRG